MEIAVQKTDRWHCITIVRDDGVTLDLRAVGRKYAPPHDLAHYVVEGTLGLRQGFWGTVADGAKFPGMTVLDGRQRPHADARSKSLMKANQRCLSEAEVMVSIFVDLLEERPNAKPAVLGPRLAERWTPAGTEAGVIGPDRIERVWTALCAMRKRWQALAVGDRIVVEWPMRQQAKAKRR